MNTLSERLRRLESLAQPVRRDEILSLDSEKPLPTPSEPIPVPKPRRVVNDIQLDDRLKTQIANEKSSHRRKELKRLQDHFYEGIEDEVSLTRKVIYGIRYVEMNGPRIAILMESVLTGQFKKTLLLSLLDEVMDSGIMDDLIDVMVNQLFPHERIVEEPEPEAVKKPSRGFSILRRK